MDFFEKHKALIITVLLMSVLLLGMYNIHVSNSNEKVRETLIELNQLRPEPEPKEKVQPEQEPKPAQPDPEFETHQAFNQNQEENQKNLESRLDEIFEKNSASQEASEEDINPTQGEQIIESSLEKEKREASHGNQSSTKTSTQKGTLRNSSIAFSLVGRTAVDIPNPIYTCDTPGKIVVNIVVNQNGEVIDTSINKNSSTSSNECLIEQALDYANRALFSRFPGKNAQPGTITYNFQD